MREIKNQFMNLSILQKIGYLIAIMIFFLIIFQGAILNSVDIKLITDEFVITLRRIGLVVAVLGRDWKLFLMLVAAPYVAIAVVIFWGEVIGYYVKLFFGIDLW